ncbi:hypothetical protein [Caproicibacter fermentans]|uniref:Uncharacterized protein n=1 Tax=Caproicibacter fermentans TaxID=2576756 RepID=A0A7G8T8M8_9FIRM|nr:hypothetical protein [Caproicibacter fermentans]QNK39969.1 hypothetical protein HCR03_14825 [Caproicibacter fermentans]
MDEKTIYGMEDCLPNEDDAFFSGMVVVLKPEALSGERHGVRQLFFCTQGADGIQDAANWPVSAVSLVNGECVRYRRGELLGLLKPELLPDRARLQLSQIRPLDSEIPKEPEFFGYCFLPDGRYASGVPLANDLEVREYIDIQSRYQHRLMICDREDCCVFEMRDGKLIFPTREAPDAQRQEPDNGMELKL